MTYDAGIVVVMIALSIATGYGSAVIVHDRRDRRHRDALRRAAARRTRTTYHQPTSTRKAQP